MQNFDAQYNQNFNQEMLPSNDFAALNFGRIDQGISQPWHAQRPFEQTTSQYLPVLETHNNHIPCRNIPPQDYGVWFRQPQNADYSQRSVYPPGYWDAYWKNYFQNYYGNNREPSYPQQYTRPQQYDRPAPYRYDPRQQYERPDPRERPEQNDRSNLNFSLQGKTIALVPGHGGHDHGNTHGGTQEKKTALEISLRLKATLERLGAKVVISREEDVLVSPGNQKSFVEQQRPDVAIAIHTDAAGSSAFGNMTLWGLPTSREFAETMQSVLSRVTESNRPVKQQTRTWNGGRLAIVHAENVPTILLETANMQNQRDAQRIQTADYQQKLVDGIAQGVFEYFNRNTRTSRR
ncbi:MAG: N-acetylmuramoyl-L-alanine amidase [Cyanobacteria bacterium TGS_CYA1]|nr:N-acetylmuramoyl-L-alanine amidase [Cyanobacteria bacterium TGS_CYA1]